MGIRLNPYFLLGAVFVLAAIALGTPLSRSLFVNGKPASADVRILDGKAFVPLADVAKALEMRIDERGPDFNLVPKTAPSAQKGPTSPPPIESGQWKLQVLGISRSSRYEVKRSKYLFVRSEIAKQGSDFLVLECQMTNTAAEKEELVFGPWPGIDTSLVDTSGQAFAPAITDVEETEGAPTGVLFLPGTKADFSLVFEVPSGTLPKSLIFTVMRYVSRGRSAQEVDKPVDLTIPVTGTKS